MVACHRPQSPPVIGRRLVLHELGRESSLPRLLAPRLLAVLVVRLRDQAMYPDVCSPVLKIISCWWLFPPSFPLE